MATQIRLTSGSILNGNPITLAAEPNVLNGNPSFHRIILEIECGMSGGNYEVIKMSSPVEAENGKEVTIDISSALRTFRDSYEYSPVPTSYPIVKFNVKAYDEYMIDGVLKSPVGVVYFPQNPNVLPTEERDKAYLRTIFGAFSDLDRLIATTGTKGVTSLSRKPTTTPHLAFYGESFVYTPPYATEQQLFNNNTLTAPQSKVVSVPKEGAQTLGYQNIYALPASEAKNRQVFRFINSFGVLESISVPRTYSKKLSVQSTPYVVARQETFNSFSRAAVRKHSNRESWLFLSDALTEEWLYWYLHEFLMSEHVWMQAPARSGSSSDVWLPVTITPEEETTILDYSKDDEFRVSFTVDIDMNGNLIH